MSRLDELIRELCPNGVKYRNLGDIAKFTYGYTDKAQEHGTARFVRITDIDNDGLLNKEDAKYVELTSENEKYLLNKGDLLLARTGATYGKTLYFDSDEPSVYASFLIKIVLDNSVVLNRYYWHFSRSSMYWQQAEKLVSKGGQQQFNANAVARISLPIPPLPIQREIVKILDNFTELTAELTAELLARKKQYEYYQEMLLVHASNAPIKRLGDTCRMKSGKAIKAIMLSEQPDNEHAYPCFGGNGIRGYIGVASHHGEYPIIGRQGALCGNVNYATGDFYATEHAVVVESLGDYNQRYLYYLLTSMNLNQYKSQGAQPGLAVGNLEELTAPVPSLEKQKQIVEVLDKFHALCNDLSSGLPAEIAARQKQYEYYRDKLLTFEPLNE